MKASKKRGEFLSGGGKSDQLYDLYSENPESDLGNPDEESNFLPGNRALAGMKDPSGVIALNYHAKKKAREYKSEKWSLTKESESGWFQVFFFLSSFFFVVLIFLLLQQVGWSTKFTMQHPDVYDSVYLEIGDKIDATGPNGPVVFKVVDLVTRSRKGRTDKAFHGLATFRALLNDVTPGGGGGYSLVDEEKKVRQRK
jgi:hypothetical protein